MSLACDLAPENGSPRWNQGTNKPMQTPFHKWYYNVISTYYTFVSTPPYSVAVQASDDDTYMYDGTNWQEFDHAPMPFRVSSNGRAMALLASDSPGLITSGSTVMRHEMWVDYDGNGFEEVAKPDAGGVARHSPMGSGRGYALGRGPNSYYHWLRSNGPTPGMEISDDGKRVAWVYFEGSAPANSPFSWQSLQQEMVCFSTSTDWSDVPSKEDVTKDFFGGIQLWRFGGPIFTKDNNGLVFWGGFSNYNVSSSSYADCRYFAGTFYSYNFSNDECRHMLDPADGGSADAAGTLYTTASKVSLSTAGSMSGSAGDVRPVTGFMGKGRDFYYVVSGYALGTGTHAGGQDRQTSGIVMCLNVSTLGGGSVNGKQNGRAFIVSGGLTRRGFCQVYYYYPMYAFYYGYFVPAKGSMGMGKSVVAKDSGHVFFASHYQSSGATKNTTYGPDQPTYWGDYGYRGMRIHGFDAEVAGPIADLTHTSIGADTANRSIHFIEATPDGSRVSYVYDDYGTYHGHSDERLGHIWDIRFDEFTGVIHPSFNKDTDSQLLVQSDSRVGEGIAHDSTGRRVFYSVKAGNGGNENQKVLYEALREADDSLTNTQAGATGGSWYNVLYAGR